MKIDEAIKILEADTGSCHEPSDPDLYDAQKLGIEALKRCKYIRTHPSEPRVWKLDGETEA